jgi:hypothetical protein
MYIILKEYNYISLCFEKYTLVSLHSQVIKEWCVLSANVPVITSLVAKTHQCWQFSWIQYILLVV